MLETAPPHRRDLTVGELELVGAQRGAVAAHAEEGATLAHSLLLTGKDAVPAGAVGRRLQTLPVGQRQASCTTCPAAQPPSSPASQSFEELLPDGPSLVEKVLETEADVSCKRNAFLMLFHTAQAR